MPLDTPLQEHQTFVSLLIPCQTCRLYSPVRIGSAGQVPGGEVASGGKVASGAKTASGSKAARVYIDVTLLLR
jgi:hypothetical protein